MSTRSSRIHEFTSQSKGNLPTHPRPMTRDEVFFLVKMNCEELMELLATVLDDGEDVKAEFVQLVQARAEPPPDYTIKGKDAARIMEEQVDALVDIDYYNGNAAAKVAFNMDDVFDVVHQANMNKRFPDGTFHKNDEGKIVKPPGWREGDVAAVVARWVAHGTRY